MNEKKIRIKDIASKHNMSVEDMCALAEKLGIKANSKQTPLSAEQAQTIDKHFEKPAKDGKPEVVIRRRNRGGQGQAQGQGQAAKPAQAQGQSQGQQPKAAQGQQPKAAQGQARPQSRHAEPIQAKVISRPIEAKAATEPKSAPEQEKQEQKPQQQAPEAKQAAAPAKEQAAPRQAEEKKAEGQKPQQAPEAKKEGAEPAPAAPRVRVISRPVQQAAAPRRDARSAGSRDGRDGARQPRDSRMGDRDGGRPSSRPGDRDAGRLSRDSRPAGRDGRDGGGRDGRDARPGQHRDASQGQRMPRSGGAGGQGGGFRSSGGHSDGGMGFGEGLDGRGGQSKKKRNKGRRETPDFQAGNGFGHHQEEHDAPRMRSKGRRKPVKGAVQPATTQPIKAAKRKLRIEGSIRVSDMAHQMGLKSNEIIKVLFNLGIMATINQSIDFDTAALVASEFSYEVEKTGFEEQDYLAPTTPDRPEDLKPRPPVVTIMGHVDHGKTSLLDAIRKTHVTSGEAGGITQHIGAYHVKTKNGDVVFLDTPGHEAFTAMRARGAQITDLVILVVAADDGVMEQTREAVNHSRAAGVPIIVAVNKMDKPGANPDRVMRELAELGLQPEDWGGDTIFAKVSAKTRQGLDELLELVALQSEVMELKANPDKAAKGHIIEAKLDKGRGPVATVLIQEGTLHQGDNFVCGSFSGRVRALLNDQGKKVREAGPSIPVEVQGFDGVPVAGEEFNSVADEKVARRIADARAIKQRERDLASESKVTLETFLASSGDSEQKTLNLVVKADVQGTLEAVQESLKKAGTEKVSVNIVHGGTGAITESDILLASASKAIIIGFNIRPAAKVKDIAARESVDIRFYDIIYKLVDDVKSAMVGLLAPVEKEVYLGQAEVRQTFSLPKVGTIAGSFVADGKLSRNAGIRLLRDGVVVYTGRISSLKRFKDDAKEVLRGNECGVGLENFNDIKVGDIIEAFETVQEAATL